MHAVETGPRSNRKSGSIDAARRRHRLTAGLGLLLLVVATLATVGTGAATAGPTIPSLPKVGAADNTPRVVDDSVVTNAGVRELRQVGSTMYAGGAFNRVLNAARTSSYTRTNLFSFDASSGNVSSWAPAVNAPVYAMEPSADGQYLYIGGDFWSFAGVSVKQLVKYDLVNNRVDTSFRFLPTATGRVSDLQLVGGRLFVAGNFPGGIVAVDPNTGAKSSYFDGVPAAGAESQFSTRIYRFAVAPGQTPTRMVVIGSFTSIGGQPRQQAAMLNLGSTTATLSPWYSTRWNEDCNSNLQWYTRDVDFSPTGNAFAIVTTGAGYPGTIKLCDTVTRWAVVDAGNQQPVWINYSGGDTFHSVNYTDRGVFVSGHFRWLDNPQGRDSKGPGAVDRLGIGAIDPVTGKALTWNPGKSVEGGEGGYDLYFTSRGLWVGHFEMYLGRNNSGTGGELHEGLGLLPY